MVISIGFSKKNLVQDKCRINRINGDKRFERVFGNARGASA